MKFLNKLIVGFLVDADPLGQRMKVIPYESCNVEELKLPKNAERWDCVGEHYRRNIVLPWTNCYLKCNPGYIATSCEFKHYVGIYGQLGSQTTFFQVFKNF